MKLIGKGMAAALLCLAAAAIAQPPTPAPRPSDAASGEAAKVSGVSDALPPPANVPGLTAANLSNPDFTRAIIVDAVGPGLKSADAIKELVAKTRDAGFNTIIAQIRAYGDGFYNSAIVPKAPGIAADLDPLSVLMTEAKAGDKPLKVYAMVVTYRVWSKSRGTAPENHVAGAHPDWITETADGVRELGDDKTELWLDPGVSEAQDHLALLAVDLVKNYKVDGIVLDRMRYPDNTLKAGYNAKAVERYNKEKSKSGKPDAKDPDWVAWRRQQVTDGVKKIRDAVKGARPDVLVIANSVTYGEAPANGDAYRKSSAAYAGVLQDWVGWAADGIIDANLLMDYKAAERNAADFDAWKNFAVENRGKAKVIVGVGGWLNLPRYTLAMTVDAIMDPNVSGIGISSYHDPAKTKDLASAAFSGFKLIFDPATLNPKAPEITALLAQKDANALGRLDRLAALIPGTTPEAPPLSAANTQMPSLPTDTAAAPVATPAGQVTALPSLSAISPASTPAASAPEPGAKMPSLGEAAAAPAAPAAPGTGLPSLGEAASAQPAPGTAMPSLGAIPQEALVPPPAAPVSSLPSLTSISSGQPAPPSAPETAPEATLPPRMSSLPPISGQPSAVSTRPSEVPGLPPVLGSSRQPVATPNPDLGQTNYVPASRMASDKPTPKPFVAPTITVPTGKAQPAAATGAAIGLRMGDSIPMSTTAAAKPDYSSESIFVPRRETVGMRDYAPREGRKPITAPTAVPTGAADVILLNNGKQFTGRVVERGRLWTIQLDNGSTIKIAGDKVADVRAGAGM
ncbi:MAG: family 10 glycosylhydrolase [Candidatus Sumerlaeaceae bacterium]|nr:family 10 glycosylhydrolase [Candidatus Sumerlaeaceae bacterium]